MASKGSTASSRQGQPSSSAPGAKFAATSWTAVLAAGRGDSPQAQEALARLCRDYWQPLYAYVRRLGNNEEDAKDLTQEFFYRLVSGDFLSKADRTKGKFRTYLLTVLEHFLTNEWRKGQTAKRGSGQAIFSLDEETEDEQPRFEPGVDASPAKIYEQHWAAAVFRQANERLSEEYAAAGKSELFAKLKEFLEITPISRGYHAVAAQLRMTPNAVGVIVHRMRHRCGELIRAEVARTLVKPTSQEIESEMRFLKEVFGR